MLLCSSKSLEYGCWVAPHFPFIQYKLEGAPTGCGAAGEGEKFSW